VFQALGLRLGRFEGWRVENRAERVLGPIRRSALDVTSDHFLAVYTRAALALQTLERLIGEETMARVMRSYHERWRFRHPRSEDFYAVASEVSGQDLDRFFEEAIESPGFLDYEVASVRTERRAPPRGILEDGAAATASQPAHDGEGGSGEEEQWRSVARLHRRGEVVLPVEVELRFEGAPSERRHWDGRDRWVEYEVTGPHPLLAAVIDPDERLVLDVNRLNNSRRVQPDGRTAAYWGARWTFWLQVALSFVGL
jgi:hypothetical protein